MIGANELRIGNHFEWSKFASMGIGQDVVTLRNIGYHNLMDPIHITEDWLISSGFGKIEESPFDNINLKYWVKNGICLFFNNPPLENIIGYQTYFLVGVADMRFGKYTVVTGKWIGSVHTLQNIFHALTGEELVSE